MPTFAALNRDWSIRFDGLLLGELRDQTGIDLADVMGESWLKIETDQATMTRAVCFLCSEQLGAITAKQLAEAICGETAEQVSQALWGAAKVFFRPRLMSALESALEKRRAMAEVLEAMRLLDSLPEAMREGALMELTAKMSGALQPSPELPSASGQAATPSMPATDSPVPVESAHAA